MTTRLLALLSLACAAYGQADLEGVWTNATPTPLERPAALKGREFYTEAEMAENAKRAQEPATVEVLGGTGAHYDFEQFGLDPSQAKHTLSRRTSMIVDPPDGRTPPLNAAGRKRQVARVAERKLHGEFDGPETRPLSERCIIWPGTGPPMLPGAYNNDIQIQQGAGYVGILLEMNHDLRIIPIDGPIDGPPHPGPGIRQYMGDSRGHWEGKTLVVDTTNFTDKTNFHGAGANLHVVERFTRMDENSILYRFTVDDPDTWDKPWTGELMMVKTPGPLFEFACHEGNYGLPNTLRGARAEEAAKEAAKAAGDKTK